MGQHHGVPVGGPSTGGGPRYGQHHDTVYQVVLSVQVSGGLVGVPSEDVFGLSRGLTGTPAVFLRLSGCNLWSGLEDAVLERSVCPVV